MHITPLKILLVDSSAKALGIRRLLAQAGHALQVVATGPEALSTLNSVYFDLVLIDVETNTTESVRTVSAIRDSDDVNATIPIIALCGKAEFLSDHQHLPTGVNGFLVKSFSLPDFDDTLRKMHNRRIFKQTS